MKLYNIYNVANSYLKNKIIGKRTPLVVSFLVTYRCNLNCKYCDTKKQKITEISTEEAIKILKEMKIAGTVKVGFTGGECLERDDIGILLQCAKELGFEVSISSNGIGVINNIDVIEKYVDIIQLSIDGEESIHDEFRGKGTFNKVINSLNALKEIKKTVLTNTVLTKKTINHLPYIIDLAKNKNFKVLVQPVFSYKLSADDNTINKYSPSNCELKGAVELLINEKKKSNIIGNSFAYLKYLMNTWPIGNIKSCNAGKLFCAVNAIGEVLPCIYFDSKSDWPNANKLGFVDAFKNFTNLSLVDNCVGCFCNAYIESHLIFSLNISACLNSIKLFK